MRTLAERLTWAREQKGLTQDALARASGVSQSTIGNLESGLRQTARKILEIAHALEVDPMWLSNGGEVSQSRGPKAAGGTSTTLSIADSPFVQAGPKIRIGDEPDTIPIRRVTIKLRAGFTGFETVPELEDGGVLHVPRQFIEDNKLVPHNLLAVPVKGCSMEPLLFDGDSVVVDTSDKEVVNREIYALNWNAESCVKQLVTEGGQWYLRSFHPEHTMVNSRSGHCEIIGRVVYQPGRALKGRL